MNILIGISGSIAIYRTCELVRMLTKEGHHVRVAMTRTAAKWVSPTIFAALSGDEVYTDNMSQKMPHIDIRKDLHLFLISPATANIIAKAANGISDNILTSTLLSFHGPRWIAPAMNPYMYSHPAVQKNISILKEFGYRILDPDNGEAVCGDIGEGKMMPIEEILKQVRNLNQ